MPQKEFINDKGQKFFRTPCVIYSRVVGFITPVVNFNHGKKSEFYSRKFYDENTSLNSKFLQDYAHCEDIPAYNFISNNQAVPVTCACH